MFDIHGVLKDLSKHRPIFCSEADFQDALAWQIHEEMPDCEIGSLKKKKYRTFVFRLNALQKQRACESESQALLSQNQTVFLGSRCPLELFLGLDAVQQIQVDQILVWNTRFVRQVLKIRDNIRPQAQCDLLFQMLCIWVFDGFREVVFFFHRKYLSYCRCSLLLAFRAEIILITVSSSR